MIILLTAAFLLAQDPGPTLDCANAQTTLDMEQCGVRDVDVAEARMRTYLAAASTALRADVEADRPGAGDDAVTALQASQKAWEAYYGQACDVVYTRWQGGTIRGIMSLDCKKRMVLQRAHDLWADYLVGLGDETPALPEPFGQVADTPPA